MIAGSTDSEHAFALYVDAWNALENERDPLQRLMEAMRKTVAQLQQWTKELEVPTQLNFAVSDGERAVFTRYGDKGAKPNSLFLHKGNRYECKDGACYMVDVPDAERAVLVASEPISGDQGWQEVAENVVMGIDADRSLTAPIALG